MHVSRISSSHRLSAVCETWNGLAGNVPMRRWQWNAAWWEHYGGQGELYVLTVRDDQHRVIGVAPWYRCWSPTLGAVLHPLGSGEVCSDYHTILAAEGHQEQVAQALARWLIQSNKITTPSAREGEHQHPAGRQDAWDLLELDGVPTGDPSLERLMHHLAHLGCGVYQRQAANLWRLQLPRTWEDYEALLSKSHRKQVRRFIRREFDTGCAKLHTVENREQLDRAMDVLIDLHQRRWQAAGQTGRFASPAFLGFHRQIARRLLEENRLRLHWLEIDGAPAAAEYHFSGDEASDSSVVYAYQAGVNPDLRSREPGHLAAVATLKLAIEQGYQVFDFLRGDEPYKAHWRAKPQACQDWRIVPPQATAQLRNRAYFQARKLKHWFHAANSAAPEDQSDWQPTAPADSLL